MAGNNSMKLNKSTKARGIAARHAAGEVGEQGSHSGGVRGLHSGPGRR